MLGFWPPSSGKVGGKFDLLTKVLVGGSVLSSGIVTARDGSLRGSPNHMHTYRVPGLKGDRRSVGAGTVRIPMVHRTQRITSAHYVPAYSTCERWFRYEGLWVVAIVVGMVLLAVLERLLLPLFRQ